MTGTSGECQFCGGETAERFGGMFLCADCTPDKDEGDSDGVSADSGGARGEGDETDDSPRAASADSYADVSFASDDLASDEWPAAHRDHAAWMCRKDGKAPWAPWVDDDAPVECTHADHDEQTSCDACRHSAKFKWGSDGSREHVHAEYQTAREWREKHPEARGDLAFIQREGDPFVFVDGDDVRDPETGELHPAFRDALDRLGVTYTDVSQSGTGVHAMYRGELPDGVKQVRTSLSDEPFGANDDTPDLEIYDGKHVCIATGDHVAGTGLAVEPWDDDAVEALLDEHDLLPDDDRPGAAFDDFDPEEYEADATGADETAEDIRDVFSAIDRLDARRVAERTIVDEWQDPSGAQHRAFVPTWASSSYDGTANFVNREVWKDSGNRAGKGGPVCMAAIDAGLVRDTDCPGAVHGETWMQAVDHLRDLGFSIPELADDHDTGSDPVVEACATPAVDRVEVDDITDRWRAIRGRLGDLGDAPTIFADEAGSGKTTNAGVGLAERDEPHAILFDKHEKAREYVRDDATPDGYFHLKGGGQPRDDGCLDAHHAGERCDDHGDTANCPRMCPVYDLDVDDPVRVEYERLVDEVGPVRAHQLLDLPDHDDDGCPWIRQFGPLARAERVVGVHEYQTLKTVRNPADGPDRQVVVDETPSVDGRDRLLDVETLVRLSNALEPRRNIGSPDDDPTEHNHLHARAELAAFTRRVVDALTDADSPDDLTDVDPPQFAPTTVEVEVDPNDLPDGVSASDVERATRKESVGMDGDRYRTVRRHVAEVDLLAETLANAKQAYEGAVLGRIRSENKEWHGEPLATDAVLAAAAAAGVDARACRQAAAVPPELSACPRCHDDLELREGRHVCPSCAWDEADDHIVGRDGAAARCDAELHAGGDGTGLHYRRLPQPSALPDAPLVLDATATPAKVAAVYGVAESEVRVQGDDTLAVDELRTTQILDGQYHASTIRASDSVRERVERSVRKLADVHGDLLVVGKLSILDELDLPTTRDGVDVLHYHAARGLNRSAYDAVVAVGAPHPDVGALERDAALLTQGRDDLRVGGAEHSTRRDCENPPVYRKLDYVDEDGEGRAVATKHYTGLTGALFREGREKELEQVVHRIRPLLADDAQHAYLLTNVPTDLHVDEVCSFDELADPIESLLPVPEGALDLLEAVRDAAAGDLHVDGARADTLVETVGGERAGDGDVAFKIDALHRLARASGLEVSERSVRRWVDGLTDLGLLDPGEYEPRAGVPYTADPTTLTEALSVLTNNASVEVAARRRFRAILAEAGGTLGWLTHARDALGLRGGDDDVDPPPDTGSAPG